MGRRFADDHPPHDAAEYELAIPQPFRGYFPSMKPIKKLIWLLPLLIILGAMLVTVEMKSQTREVTIYYDYNNLFDTRGRPHSVRLVFHPNGSVTWLDLTRHL